MATPTSGTFHFWTREELKSLTKLSTQFEKVKDIVDEFAKTSARTKASITFKYYAIAKDPNIGVKKLGRPIRDIAKQKLSNASVEKLNTSTKKSIDLPSGFVFNFVPKKAEMHDNHVRLYF